MHIYKCSVVWCREKKKNIMAARTDFIEEIHTSAKSTLAEPPYLRKYGNPSSQENLVVT